MVKTKAFKGALKYAQATQSFCRVDMRRNMLSDSVLPVKSLVNALFTPYSRIAKVSLTRIPILCYTGDMNPENPDRQFEELKHQIELLENKVEADMRVLQAERKESKAENDSAIERLRTDMERGHNKLLVVLIIVGVAVIGLLYRGIGS